MMSPEFPDPVRLPNAYPATPNRPITNAIRKKLFRLLAAMVEYILILQTSDEGESSTLLEPCGIRTPLLALLVLRRLRFQKILF